MTRISYRHALRAKGVKALPKWPISNPQPGDRILTRVDRPAIVVRATLDAKPGCLHGGHRVLQT